MLVKPCPADPKHVQSSIDRCSHCSCFDSTLLLPLLQALLDAGADLTGKTHLDELAYSLNGENYHYGTPVNPACPARIPGGSSSGSAVSAQPQLSTSNFMIMLQALHGSWPACALDRKNYM